MLCDLQTALQAYLQSQVAEGKHLEGVDLVQFGAHRVPAQFNKAVTVDWDDSLEFKREGNRFEVSANFTVGIYTSSAESEEIADRQLQDALTRWDGDRLLGVLPALAAIGNMVGASGRRYKMELDKDLARGSAKERSTWRSGAIAVLTATVTVAPAQFLPT